MISSKKKYWAKMATKQKGDESLLIKKFVNEECIMISKQEKATKILKVGNIIETKGEFFNKYVIWRQKLLSDPNFDQKQLYTINLYEPTEKVQRPGLAMFGRVIKNELKFDEKRIADSVCYKDLITNQALDHYCEHIINRQEKSITNLKEAAKIMTNYNKLTFTQRSTIKNLGFTPKLYGKLCTTKCLQLVYCGQDIDIEKSRFKSIENYVAYLKNFETVELINKLQVLLSDTGKYVVDENFKICEFYENPKVLYQYITKENLEDTKLICRSIRNVLKNIEIRRVAYLNAKYHKNNNLISNAQKVLKSLNSIVSESINLQIHIKSIDKLYSNLLIDPQNCSIKLFTESKCVSIYYGQDSDEDIYIIVSKHLGINELKTINDYLNQFNSNYSQRLDQIISGIENIKRNADSIFIQYSFEINNL